MGFSESQSLWLSQNHTQIMISGRRREGNHDQWTKTRRPHSTLNKAVASFRAAFPDQLQHDLPAFTASISFHILDWQCPGR
jgi:hypothetical protein